jgi:hypothetical protein
MGETMKPPAESVKEILKGLEGLQMLSQWEQSLARDLASKAETLLRSLCAAPPATGPDRSGPEDVP